MKFLIAIGHNIKNPVLSISNFFVDDFGTKNIHPFAHTIQNICFLASQKPSQLDSRNKNYILWDGSPIHPDTAFSSIMPIPDASRKMADYLNDVQTGKTTSNFSGIFGCASIEANGKCVIASDPLSQYSVFFVSDQNRYLFSNSLHLIEKACKLLRISVTRDFTSNAYEIAFGAGGWTRTGLSRVFKMPPNHYMRYDQGKVDFLRNHFSVFSDRHNAATYSSKIRIAADSLKSSALAMSKLLPNEGLVLDLSGGKDTRLVLGAQLAAQPNNFSVFLGGPSGGDDQKTASRLVCHYNLDSVNFLSNIGADENISAIEAARRAAYRYMGTSNQYQAELGTLTLSGCAQVRGGASEGRTRSFYNYPSGKRLKKILSYSSHVREAGLSPSFFKKLRHYATSKRTENKLTALILARGKAIHRFFHTDFLKSAHESILSNIMWLKEQGVAGKNLADTYYI